MLPIKPRKPLGQNFINDSQIINQISSIIIQKIEKTTQIFNITNFDILEIGASYGIISFNILNQLVLKNINFNSFLLNEIDYRLIKKLETKIESNTITKELFRNQKIKIINSPFQNIDLEKFNNLIIIGNIPFYITGKVLRKITDYNKNLKLVVLNLQKEVVDKIRSQNNAQSIILNMIYSIDYHIIIHPKYYTPQPKVFSQIISFTKKQELSKDYVNKAYNILDRIYKNKNKKINNLLTLKEIEKINNFTNKNPNLNYILEKRGNNIDLWEAFLLLDILVNDQEKTK